MTARKLVHLVFRDFQAKRSYKLRAFHPPDNLKYCFLPGTNKVVLLKITLEHPYSGPDAVTLGHYEFG